MTIADPGNLLQNPDRTSARKNLEEPKSNLEEIDLHKYWLVLRRRWPVALIVFLALVIPGLILTLKQRPNYEAMGKLQFQSSRVPSLTGVGEKIGELQALETQGNPLNTEAVVVESLPVLQQAIDTLGLKGKDGKPMDAVDLAKQVKVEPILRADVLEVKYQTNDPKLAAAVVNQVMKAYIARNLLTNRAQAIAAGDFISKQLPRARADVDRIAEELRRFREKNRIIDLERETVLMAENVSRLDEQLNTTQANLADIATQASTLRQRLKMSSDRALDVASLSQVKAVQETMGELQAARRKLATERTRFTDDHPTIAVLKDQIAELNALLQQQVAQTVGPNAQVSFGDLQIGETKQAVINQLITAEAQQSGLERKVAALTALRDAYRKRTDVIPNLGKRQEELERDLKVAQETYEGLLGRLQQIRVAENQNVGNARVIQDAVIPKTPSRSSKKLILGGSIFLGVMLGVAAAFFVDLIDRSLKTVKEARSLFGYPLLGMIPHFEVSHGIEGDQAHGISPRVIVASAPRSILHEAYQMLWANLRFTSSDKRVRTIVITSSVPQEGKSEVSANLAATIAQAGRRVLLVDADLRHPSQHHLWDRVNSQGLSNLIAGQGEMAEMIQVINSHLSILTAGAIPPNPSALLDSEAMVTLIERFSQDYDYILLDTPPLAWVADAAVLGKMVDGVVLVVRPGVVNSATATAAKTLLSRSAPNVLGLVANDVDTNQEPDGFFYYTTNPSEAEAERPKMLSRVTRSLTAR